MMLFAVAVGTPVIFTIWLLILFKWQRGYWMLLLYIPFAGLVTLAMRPSPLGTLVKDLLFVLPTYAVFFLLHTRELQRIQIPRLLTLLIVLFASLTMLQLFNPNVKNFLVGVIGVKVWLLYLPMLYISAVFFSSAEVLLRVLRVCTVLTVISCSLGLVQFVLGQIIGYQQVMTMMYGSAAAAATQNFTSFDMGAEFFRIPSTFSFLAQYAGFCLVMMPVIYMLQTIEPDARWRLFARIAMGVLVIASVLSGSRGNWLFTPLLFLMILLIDAKLTRLAIGIIFGPVLMLSALYAGGFDIFLLFQSTAGLTQDYGRDLVIPDLIRALTNSPLGSGTGINTGGATNIMSEIERATTVMTEGYYAKAIIELGIPGLMLLLMIIATVILYGLNLRHRLRDPKARSCAAAITAFLIVIGLHSFKGWLVDLDPINVWYWVLAGILFALPQIRLDDLNQPPHRKSRRAMTRSSAGR
jgi:hypothetical protein